MYRYLQALRPFRRLKAERIRVSDLWIRYRDRNRDHERLTAKIHKPLKISVMGCPLNGIGEGEGSDLGIAGGKEKSVLLKNGKIYKTVDSANLMEEFMILLNEVL